jgi:DNA repair protein RadC
MSNIINRYIKMSHGTLNESTNLRKLCAKSLEQFDQVNEAGPAETIVDMM